MDQAAFDKLKEAERLLLYATDDRHYCEEKDCTVESPKCPERHAQAALKALSDVLEPPHEGLHPGRLVSDPERIYAERWKKENERHAWLNSGYTLVEHLLCPEGQRHPDRVTFRDAQVAAAVIQWLGTACGRSLYFNVRTRNRSSQNATARLVAVRGAQHASAFQL